MSHQGEVPALTTPLSLRVATPATEPVMEVWEP